MPRSNPPHKTLVLRYGKAAIARAAELISSGQPVAIPTETVYGLAADATNGEAVARIYAAKGRPVFNPLIVHVLDLAAAERIGVLDDAGRRLADRFWPGPLTLVVPVRRECGLASLALAGLKTIAVRVPQHPAIRDLIAATRVPLAAPSANASGLLSPTLAAHVMRTLGGRIPMIVDGGATAGGLESTIVAVDDGKARILREGPITRDMLAEVIGIADDSGTETITAPGQLASHYAPTKPMRLNVTDSTADEWLIGFGVVPGDANLSQSGNSTEAARRLFALLHDADASSKPRIAVAPIPAGGIGSAINDRLRRAAHRSAR